MYGTGRLVVFGRFHWQYLLGGPRVFRQRTYPRQDDVRHYRKRRKQPGYYVVSVCISIDIEIRKNRISNDVSGLEEIVRDCPPQCPR